VLPALLLNYIGQSAHLMRKPEDISSLFYHSVPSSLFWPELILATLATVIASQAMISGVFSLVSQAVSFQYFPNVKVLHTSKHQLGQVCIPFLRSAFLSLLSLSFFFVFVCLFVFF
jgi:KUP system potassium uptake protein